MEKQKIRIATLRGKGTYKRCRKEEHLFAEGIGNTDEEAISNLLINLEKEQDKCRCFDWNDQVLVFDAIRNIDGDWSSIMRPLMPYCKPEDHNTIFLSLKDIMASKSLVA